MSMRRGNENDAGKQTLVSIPLSYPLRDAVRFARRARGLQIFRQIFPESVVKDCACTTLLVVLLHPGVVEHALVSKRKF